VLEKREKAKGLTLKKILSESIILDLNNAKDVHVTNVKETVSAKGRKAVVATCFSDPKGNKVPTKYKCSVIGLEDDGPLSGQRCMFSCECDRYMYYYEYALAQKGAAKIKFCNGNAPTVTNPSLIPGGCKHLIALSRKLVKEKK
jgi:hypothetical protein